MDLDPTFEKSDLITTFFIVICIEENMMFSHTRFFHVVRSEQDPDSDEIKKISEKGDDKIMPIQYVPLVQNIA